MVSGTRSENVLIANTSLSQLPQAPAGTWKILPAMLEQGRSGGPATKVVHPQKSVGGLLTTKTNTRIVRIQPS
jgi:hypothetical protein